MEVILIKDMENLGYANDIVNVKPGYANNYLIPQGYAKAATASAKKVLAENLKQRAHKDAKILADAQALAETIANLPLSLAVKAEEGKLFGTVTATDLAEALAATPRRARDPFLNFQAGQIRRGIFGEASCKTF